MTRISSRYTALYKKLLPAAWFAFLAVFVVATTLGGAAIAEPALVYVPFGMMVFGFFLFRHMVWNLADEVYDCGDSLLVRNRGQEARIPLSNIRKVDVSTARNPPRVRLELAVPCMLGDVVTFSPVKRFSLNPFAGNEVAESLVVRVDEARAGRAM